MAAQHGDGGSAKPLKKTMDPGRLRKLIDSPSPANATREIPTAIAKEQTLETSWNRERCDTRPFEKLQATAHVVLTKDQRAVRLSANATGNGHFKSGLQVAPVMTTKEGVAHAVEIEHKPVPRSVLLHEGLMTPQQRRERLQFETTYHHARRAIQQADNNER
ncbi:hypothetical protein FI667_g9501, partial [Globisporangium splendens]